MTDSPATATVDFDRDIDDFAAEVAEFCAGRLPADQFKKLAALRGIYEQRKSGTYMLRVRLTAGVLTAAQGRALAGISQRYTEGQVHVTTRQNIQFHGLSIGDAPEVMRELRQVGLLSKGGGGNTVRTVVTCPYAGACPSEVMDVTPYARAITDYLLALPGSYTLPRKFKIACSGCRADCALAKATDVGYVAEVRNSEPGFVLYAGGGMGAHSRLGDRLRDWIPASEILRTSETVRRLFDRWGDRTNRARARLRFVVDRIGVAAFREAFDAELKTVGSEGVPSCKVSPATRQSAADEPPRAEPPTAATGGLRTIQQHQPGLVSVPLHVPLGVLPASDLDALSRLSETFSGEGGPRTTQDQNMILRSVAVRSLPALATALRSLKTNVIAPAVLEHFIVCTGASICRLGLCWSRGVAGACAAAIETAGLSEALTGVAVHISGCPNACGQHPLAVIGLCGAMLRHDGRSLPAYKVLVGGTNRSGAAALGSVAGILPARAVPGALVALLRDYQAKREQGESLRAYVHRAGLAYLEALIKPYSVIPAHDLDPSYYHDWGQAPAK
jgi:sulfite reductase (ferredoxin)